MKRNFKQSWSAIPPISTKRTIASHNPIFRHIKSNNSGTAKVKMVKNERDPPLFTSKQLIKFLKDTKKHNSSYRTT
jgi:hypothetical protein